MHAQEGFFRSFCLAILVHISVCVDAVSQDEGCCGSFYVAFVRVVLRIFFHEAISLTLSENSFC